MAANVVQEYMSQKHKTAIRLWRCPSGKIVSLAWYINTPAHTTANLLYPSAHSLHHTPLKESPWQHTRHMHTISHLRRSRLPTTFLPAICMRWVASDLNILSQLPPSSTHCVTHVTVPQHNPTCHHHPVPKMCISICAAALPQAKAQPCTSTRLQTCLVHGM